MISPPSHSPKHSSFEAGATKAVGKLKLTSVKKIHYLDTKIGRESNTFTKPQKYIEYL